MHFGSELNQITEALFQCFVWKQFSFSMLADYAVFNSCWRDDWWKAFSLWVCFQVQTELWHSNPGFLLWSLLRLRVKGLSSSVQHYSLRPRFNVALGTPDFIVWDGSVVFQGASSNHEGIGEGKTTQNTEQESVEDGGCILAVGAEKGLQD